MRLAAIQRSVRRLAGRAGCEGSPVLRTCESALRGAAPAPLTSRAASRRESLLELQLQPLGCHVLLRRRKFDLRVRVLEVDEIDVAEDVLAVGVLVAVAFLEGTWCSVPMDQAHPWSIDPLRGKCGAAVDQ